MKSRSALEKETLAWLIAPVTVSDFFENHFERQPLAVVRGCPKYFHGLLTLEEVDRVLTVFHPGKAEIDVVKQGSVGRIKSEEYLGPGGFVDPARVARLFADGATIIFPALHRKLAKLAELRASLEAEFTQPFQTNVYLTPPESQGFDVHYDSHDVFVVQVAGSKIWNLYRTPIELPLTRQAFVQGEYDPGPVTRSLELRAGDVLYIPRGLMHDARATRETSLHITIGAVGYNWADLMAEAVATLCLADPAFRKTLPPGFAHQTFDRREAREYFAQLVKKLADRSDLDSLFDFFADHFIGTREVPLPGQLEAMDPAKTATVHDIFGPRPHLVYRLEKEVESQTVTLRGHGFELTLPATMEGAVRFALEHPCYRPSDLPVALSLDDKLTLAARLVREGLLQRKAVARQATHASHATTR